MSSPAELAQKTIDASGLHCPQPILRCMAAMVGLAPGAVLRLITTDPDAVREIGLFIANTDHSLLETVAQDQQNHFYIQKACAHLDTTPSPSMINLEPGEHSLVPC